MWRPGRLEARDYPVWLLVPLAPPPPPPEARAPCSFCSDRLRSMFLHLWIYQRMVMCCSSATPSRCLPSMPPPRNDLDPNDFLGAERSCRSTVGKRSTPTSETPRRLSAKTGIFVTARPRQPGDDTALRVPSTHSLELARNARYATWTWFLPLLKQLERPLPDKFFEFEQNYADPKTQALWRCCAPRPRAPTEHLSPIST